MGRVQIVIRQLEAEADSKFDAASIEAALIVSDINIGRGTAELFEQGRRVARLTKRGTGHAPYWEVE